METTFDVPARTFLRVVYGDDGEEVTILNKVD